MSYDPMRCPCEHGGNCRMVRACAVDEMMSDAVYQAELKADDDHAAFVARAREIAEGMEHDLPCSVARSNAAWGNQPKPDCTCPRGKLLALCEVSNG